MKVDEIVIKSLPSSFVFRNLKLALDNGAGEAKLHIGSAKNSSKFDGFFERFSEDNKFYFQKENMLLLLQQQKLEYIYQSINKYSELDYNYWSDKFQQIKEINDDEFEFKLIKFEDSSRYYIRSDNNIFKNIFRKIALPKITNLIIEKYQDGNYYKYYFKLELNLELDKPISKEFYQENENYQELHKGIVSINYPRNRILFGAPGTGKSFKIEEERDIFGTNYERVTFHPNYSYAQFVGTYKPKPKYRNDGNEYVSYEFVPGPFLRTWINAQNSLKNGSSENFLLIIEEINRANSAAVFGDTFQLLDRDINGTSEYEISISEDMREYLIKCGFDSNEVQTIKLPSNMYIWATMNSSDQGVSPMDSAFKRRWNFEYIGINDGYYNIAGRTIKLKYFGEIEWDFLRKKINDRLTQSDLNINEDKLIGPFFISKNEINSYLIDDIFKSKLLMYLFEDVLKHRKGLFKSELNTFSKVISAYDNNENIFDFDVIEPSHESYSDEYLSNKAAEDLERY